MADRDEEHRRTDRYRYQYYDNAKRYEKQPQLTVKYDSDNERERRRQWVPSSAESRQPSLMRATTTRRDFRPPSFRRVPSPPPLSRNRSTGRDQRLPRFERGARAETSQYLTLGNGQKPHEEEVSRSEIPSPTFVHPPVPKILVSEAFGPHDSEPHHSDNSWTRSPAAEYPTKTIFQGSCQPQSPREPPGVLGERMYQYNPLGPFEFRLVRILSKKMTTIKCEIECQSLTNPPPYTAISYAWGDADDKRSIQIGKTKISVAVSLFGALDAIRKREEDVLVWVDALCIDQQNRDERSKQVQLMTEIYAKATLVAIWLGPSENDSQRATELLQDIAIAENDPEEIAALLLSPGQLQAIEAVVHLFQRDYWKRLWVVQEVSNAKTIKVFCGGSTAVPWPVYTRAARIFQRHKKDLDSRFSISSVPKSKRNSALPSSLSYSQALVYEGPNSLLDMNSANSLVEEGSLLNIIRAYRRKLTSEPRDKVFGILGVLPQGVRKEFLVDYSLSIKEVYTNVVDYLLNTTSRLDVICESIHFPKQTGTTNLPSWVPDWSQTPEITALGYSYGFHAADDTDAKWDFLDRQRRNELEISAIYIGTIWKHGVAVGALCSSADYLMAFLHWRAIFLDYISFEDPELQKEMELAFCRTICLGQIPREQEPDEWMRKTYRVFATLLRNRLPKLPLDDVLSQYTGNSGNTEINHRQLLQSHFGSHMMGRCFFLTKNNRLGMGTGFMLPGDMIIVPLGCRTPIIIREEDRRLGRYRLVGDAYLDGYMDGEAIRQSETGAKSVEKFVLV
ncbi:heterokaryon incompatibility protein-domain-containing protein [Xylaria sp. FL1042]|nr:heterokaryon incompatibility protein-domain-containing protein [Xylaria sp. FL1042]